MPRHTAHLALMLAAAAVLQAGCARTVFDRPQVTAYNHEILTEEVAYWHSLPGRSAITNDEGFHGLILFAEGEDVTTTWDERLAHVKRLGWVDEGFDEAPNLAMQRGRVARAVALTLEIEGGVMMRLTGTSPRYATRELQYLGIIGPGTDMNVVSGLEFLSIIARAEEWREARAPDEGT